MCQKVDQKGDNKYQTVYTSTLVGLKKNFLTIEQQLFRRAIAQAKIRISETLSWV